MTAPIARVAASKLLKQQIPLRLAYSANVYRAQQREGGRPAEFEQIGIECIGNKSISADAEMIALLADALKAAGLQEFKISIGHIGFLQEFFLSILGTEERASILRKFLYEKIMLVIASMLNHCRFHPLINNGLSNLPPYVAVKERWKRR